MAGGSPAQAVGVAGGSLAQAATATPSSPVRPFGRRALTADRRIATNTRLTIVLLAKLLTFGAPFTMILTIGAPFTVLLMIGAPFTGGSDAATNDFRSVLSRGFGLAMPAQAAVSWPADRGGLYPGAPGHASGSDAREADAYSRYRSDWAREADSIHQLYATSPPNIFYHTAGLLELMVTNIGTIGNPGFVSSQSAGWKRGEYLFGAGLWVGAIAQDNLPYVSTGFTTAGGVEFELRPSLDPTDTVYPSFEGAPGGNRPGFSASPDDDGDGLVDEEFLNGRDDDGDGRIDEDYAAVSQEMMSCEYRDYTEEAISAYPDHRPMDLRIRQTSYAWSTPGSNEFIGFDFTIFNDGIEKLRQVYLGFFVDSDAGPPDVSGYFSDDAGGYYSTDTLLADPTISFACQDGDGPFKECRWEELHMDIMYMHDVPDDGMEAVGGDVDGYFGGMFLGHTTDPFGERAPATVQMHTGRFFSSTSVYPDGDPRDDAERYDLLQSGRRPTRPASRPSDYRYAFSAGPFSELLPGESLDLQVAFVIGAGKQGMIRNAVTAQKVYNGAWTNADGNPGTGLNGEETCLTVPEPGDQFFWQDPCDSLSASGIWIRSVDCIPENYVDNDCDCCTPLYKDGADLLVGKETLVHWVGTVAPPPPLSNLDDELSPYCENQGLAVEASGDRRIVLNWDNQSELIADPIQRRILFAGYRVWRVEGWERPIGSVGPSVDEWQLLADLSLDPADGTGTNSPWHLSRYVNEVEPCFLVQTGSTDPEEAEKWYYPVGRYSFVDSLGLKNGMKYFYDVTAYSAWYDERGRYHELAGRPAALEEEAVTPRWTASAPGELAGVAVVPNPWISGRNPAGWDLIPADHDPTGTRIAFINLPAEESVITIYTLAGDLVQRLDHDGRSRDGTVYWNLISRNGQDVVSGVYLYHVRSPGGSTNGRFVIVR